MPVERLNAARSVAVIATTAIATPYVRVDREK